MARTDTLTNYLTDVATAIKAKKGDSTPILASNFDTEIANLPSGGGGSENTIIDYSLISKTGTNSKYINYAITKVPSFDATDYTNFKDMFKNCSNLESVTITNTSSVTNMSSMFSGCNALKSVPQINTSNVTTVENMFYNCSNLESIPQMNTSNVTNMSNMFYGCSKLVNVPQMNTSNVTNMSSMFNNCTALESIPQFDTSNVTIMSNMFQYCENIDYSYRMNTSKVTSMFTMFNRNRKMTIIPITSMEKVTDASSMFANQAGRILPDSELDYLLQLLIGATAYKGTKKLTSLGFQISTSSTAIFPPSRWQALPHYQDFIDAGWVLQ